jgi:peroxiredoxin Q/BCP
MTLDIGKKAPAFNLPDKDGNNIALKDIDAKYTVVYFYPKDNTPGCSIEAAAFSQAKKDFEKLGAHIIGISGGDEKSKTKFCDKLKLNIDLLSDDEEFKTSTKYDVYGEKKFMGKTYMGISRVTYILDENKKIIKVYDKVKPPIHAKEILEFIKSYE